MTDKIIAGMATTPERLEYATQAAASLASQVDEVHVHVNGQLDEAVAPGWTPGVVWWSSDEDLSDGGKFRHLEAAVGYLLSCDDDIVYPPTYVEDMVRTIEKYARKAVITLHGSVFPRWPVPSYYRGRNTHHCRAAVGRDVGVMVPGTGVSAWHSSAVPPWPRDLFELPRMADLWFGRHLQAHEVPAVVAAHKADYLKVLEVPNTIYEQFQREGDALPTEVANRDPWRVFVP